MGPGLENCQSLAIRHLSSLVREPCLPLGLGRGLKRCPIIVRLTVTRLNISDNNFNNNDNNRNSNFVTKDKVASTSTKIIFACVVPNGTTYVDCTSPNGICLITWNRCSLQYARETVQKLH